MQYFSCGSDKYTEIKMCDLEPFSKIRSQIMMTINSAMSIKNLKSLPKMIMIVLKNLKEDKLSVDSEALHTDQDHVTGKDDSKEVVSPKRTKMIGPSLGPLRKRRRRSSEVCVHAGFIIVYIIYIYKMYIIHMHICAYVHMYIGKCIGNIHERVYVLNNVPCNIHSSTSPFEPYVYVCT